MKNLNEYRNLILGWARDRNLIDGSTPAKQLDKLFEELGEFAGAAARSNVPEKRDEMLVKMQDGLGDVFVVLTIVADQLEVELDFDNLEEYEDKPLNSMMYLCAGCLAGVVASLDYSLDYRADAEDNFTSLVSVSRAVAKSYGFDYAACIDMAWNEIKDRKGRMVDGVFVKETDL